MAPSGELKFNILHMSAFLCNEFSVEFPPLNHILDTWEHYHFFSTELLFQDSCKNNW